MTQPDPPVPPAPVAFRPMIRRGDDRTITAAGVVVAALLVGLAGLAAIRAGLGGPVWLPLHLALAGGAGTAIAAVLPFFTTALGKAAPAPAPLRAVAITAIAGGTLLAAFGMTAAQPELAALGGAAYLGGLGATAAAAFLPLRAALGFRLRLVELAYLAALAEVTLGVLMATAMLAGWQPVVEAWASLKPAHAWLNAFGFASLVVAASLTHLAPTVAGGRIRPRRSASVALGCLMLGAPLVALGFAMGWDIVGRLGAVVELAGACALAFHGAAVQRDRGRWTSDAGWHRFAGWSLLAAPGWLIVALVAGAGRVLWLGPLPATWDLRLLVVPLVAGWIGQVLVGAWTQIIPAVGPGDQARHAIQRRRLGRAATSRWLAWNAGVGLWSAGIVADSDVVASLGGALLGIALVAALVLLLLAALPAIPRRARAAAGGARR